MLTRQEIRRRSYLKHWEKNQADRRRWNEANPDKVRRQKERWRARHKMDTAFRNQVARWRRTARRLLVLQELGGKCVDCSEDYPLFLEFDHASGDKTHNVCERGSLAAIRAEASKCVVRCSNHHRLKTWVMQDRLAWRKGGGT